MTSRYLCSALLGGLLIAAGCSHRTSTPGTIVEDPLPTPTADDGSTSGNTGGGSAGVPDGGGAGAGGSGGSHLPQPGGSGSGLDPLDPDDPGSGAEPVPEPATMLLFGTGLTGLALFRRRRRRHADALTDSDEPSHGAPNATI